MRIATLAMTERGLEPEFSQSVAEQLSSITGAGREAGAGIKDLTGLPWCSIDNDDSRDLDQLTVCHPLDLGAVRVQVAIADVDAVVEKDSPGASHIGHFGLAVVDYSHSTAPNRRFPDLVTQRLTKAAMQGVRAPYSGAELAALAVHNTRQDDAARKVERTLRKSEAALVLESRIGQQFNARATGSTGDGAWVRIFSPPAEGKLVAGDGSLQVGDKLRVTLVSTSVERGFIDFERIG